MWTVPEEKHIHKRDRRQTEREHVCESVMCECSGVSGNAYMMV